MEKEELAKLINDRRRGEEIYCSEESLAKRSGLVVVFGSSGGIIKLRGAIDHDVNLSCGKIYFIDGNISSLPTLKMIEPISGNWLYQWEFLTNIPSSKFYIVDDEFGEEWSEGIVFSVNDI